MFRLAHLSDIHLGPLPPVRRIDLMSKRLTGYINWHRNRKDDGAGTRQLRLVADMRSHQPDHIAITGDLVNIGLPAEIDNARAWLESLGPPDKVTVIPGNHDAYVRSSIETYLSAWQPFMRGDSDLAAAPTSAAFPFLRRRGRIALIAVSTALATPPFMATGTIGSAQLRALAELLRLAGRQGLFRIVLIHHPPLPKPLWRRTRRLTDAANFRDVIAAEGAGLVLHGHDHERSLAMIDGPNHPVPVIGVPAASGSAHAADRHAGEKASGYALHEIEAANTGYRVTTIHRANVSGDAFEDVERIQFQQPNEPGRVDHPTATQA